MRIYEPPENACERLHLRKNTRNPRSGKSSSPKWNGSFPGRSSMTSSTPSTPAGKGRSPVGLERMIRIHFLQSCFHSVRIAVEEALYVMESKRRCKIERDKGDFPLAKCKKDAKGCPHSLNMGQKEHRKRIRLSRFNCWTLDQFLFRGSLSSSSF
jgi:hypothetical protein